MIRAVVMVGLIFAGSALAAIIQKPVMVFSPGTISCGRWTTEPTNSPNRETRRAWLYGFVTAYNVYAPSGEGVSPVDGAAMDAWVTNYCSVHPLEPLVGAAESLVAELMEQKGLPKMPPWSE